MNAEFGSLAARRFGYERNDTSWQAIAEADDIDVVSVVIANSLHREVVEGLLAAGKHVLCEKPLSDTLEDARAMADAARNAEHGRPDRLHLPPHPGHRLHPRPHPAPASWATSCTSAAATGPTTAADPRRPMSWRYKGGPGSGALADVGSHLTYVAEFLCGDIKSRSAAAGSAP